MRGHLVEGVERTRAALAMPEAAAHPAERADGLSALAGLTYWQGAAPESRAAYEAEIELRRSIGDRRGLAEALYGISFTWSISDIGDERTAAEASRYIEEALAIFREIGDEYGVGRCEWALSNVWYGRGDVEKARQHSSSALAVFEAAGDEFMVGWTRYTLALADLSEFHQRRIPGLLDSAAGHLTRSLETFDAAADISGYTLVLDAFALLAVHRDDRPLAARLSGVVHRLELETGTGINLWNRSVLGFDPKEISDSPELQAAYEAGLALDVKEGVRLAPALGRAGAAAPQAPDTG
jgi:tetratricopeptide (TPR) repeat protein